MAREASGSDRDVDRLGRDALRTFRLEAFDNVDVGAFLAEVRLTREDARWIAAIR